MSNIAITADEARKISQSVPTNFQVYFDNIFMEIQNQAGRGKFKAKISLMYYYEVQRDEAARRIIEVLSSKQFKVQRYTEDEQDLIEIDWTPLENPNREE